VVSPKKKISKKIKSAGFNLTPFVLVLALIALVLTIYIGYKASISSRKLFSISLLALFGGLLFESFRISDNWKNVIYIFIGTYCFSLISFLPGKREYNYNLENHIEMWPYVFIFFFSLAFALFNKNKVTLKLTEGITLLQSISLIYWAIDYGFTNYYNWASIILLSIGFIFSAFSFLHAFTYIKLTKTTRLTLSIWSSVIMLSFALDNIIRVFSNQDIESSKYLSLGLYIGLQYFLLGVSAVYIMQNFILLTEFLPSKNGNYRDDLKENKKAHIDRFADKQVLIKHSFFCILYASIIYVVNYKYQILPRHSTIWLVFLTFPLLIYLTNSINKEKLQ
jgi:hypothetical protein